ncbi:MAG: signal recognition particle-docking protein FtsY [Anaerolineaceae bacterium 4572_78]|nr:MAG: signal recognition particle-docking protein FtsY [Anaerolineaceae bacterium 4572_78]
MFGKIRDSLSKTRNNFMGHISNLFAKNDISDDLWDELEEVLIQSDVGVDTTLSLVETVKNRVKEEHIKQTDEAKNVLKEEMGKLISSNKPLELDRKRLLTVVMVVGVNGSGKTTTAAKLAWFYQNKGEKVILSAADTFRAAGIEQLQIWGERCGAAVIAHRPNSDPGAVIYDSLKSAYSRKASMVIIDTAGRLHTKYNLMRELEKLYKIAGKQVHDAPHESLLILDATTGQNAISQAKHFMETAKISGVILTKLDGTAKGGVVFAINSELDVPVRFIGTGETLEDIAPFDAEEFVNGLFENGN